MDRAGLVGRDGETHQGIFDISFMSAIPNLTMIAPKDKRELEEALEFAMDFDASCGSQICKRQCLYKS